MRLFGAACFQNDNEDFISTNGFSGIKISKYATNFLLEELCYSDFKFALERGKKKKRKEERGKSKEDRGKIKKERGKRK